MTPPNILREHYFRTGIRLFSLIIVGIFGQIALAQTNFLYPDSQLMSFTNSAISRMLLSGDGKTVIFLIVEQGKDRVFKAILEEVVQGKYPAQPILETPHQESVVVQVLSLLSLSADATKALLFRIDKNGVTYQENHGLYVLDTSTGQLSRIEPTVFDPRISEPARLIPQSPDVTWASAKHSLSGDGRWVYFTSGMHDWGPVLIYWPESQSGYWEYRQIHGQDVPPGVLAVWRVSTSDTPAQQGANVTYCVSTVERVEVSYDGKRIIFPKSIPNTGQSGIGLKDFDEPEKFIPLAQYPNTLKLSPDGNWLAFATNTGKASQLAAYTWVPRMMNINERQIVALPSPLDWTNMTGTLKAVTAISQDGKHVAYNGEFRDQLAQYTGSYGFWVDTSSRRLVQVRPFIEDRSSIESLSYSGKEILFSYGGRLNGPPSDIPNGNYVLRGEFLAPLVVSSVGDEPDVDPNDTTVDVNLSQYGAQTTLRAAIQEAERRPGMDSISFLLRNVFGPDRPQIRLNSGLPTITESIILNAGQAPYTIGLHGANAGSTHGLHITASNCVIKGLGIGGFDGHGILLENGGGNRIENCSLGTKWGLPSNRLDGIHVRSANNLITNIIARGNLEDGVEIDGINASNNIVRNCEIGDVIFASDGNGRHGLVISNASHNIIGGLGMNTISGNAKCGVVIAGEKASYNQVGGNRIGTSKTINGEVPNKMGGIWMVGGASFNFIGQNSTAWRNLISGNYGFGICLEGTNTTHNRIAGNYVGPDHTGTNTVWSYEWSGGFRPGNNGYGIWIQDAPNNSIEDQNIIAGNTLNGIRIEGVYAISNRITGNLIGTSCFGDKALPNRLDGVFILNARSNLIGADVANGSGNLISGNMDDGIEISGSNAVGNVLLRNWIGVDASGTSRLGNKNAGIRISGAIANRLGDMIEGGNVISGNLLDGVVIEKQAFGNHLQGNWIGVSKSGINPLGNGTHGIVIRELSTSNIVGLTLEDLEPGAGRNIIAFNHGSGIGVGPDCIFNAVLVNDIFANGQLAIDLGMDDLTANDWLDADTGANEFQNYPLIRTITHQSGRTVVSGRLDSKPNTKYRLEFHYLDPDYFQHYGRTFLGLSEVTTDEKGQAPFEMSFAGTLNDIVATATDPLGNTSEFSTPVLVVNTTGEEPDPLPGDGYCDVNPSLPGNQCTLRAAIMEANASRKRMLIAFDLSPDGPGYDRSTRSYVIRPTSPLPPLTNSMVIDATSQMEYRAGYPVVELSGRLIQTRSEGLVVLAGKCKITGLVITGFTDHGLVLRHGGTNLIYGNFIGTDVEGIRQGESYLSSNEDAIYIDDSPANVIGLEGLRGLNLLSANGGNGVQIRGPKAFGNVVQGNYIGTSVAGTNTGFEGLGNLKNGVLISGAPSNTIGGLKRALGNLISGNRLNGIHIIGSTAMGNRIQGNFIGTDSSGARSDQYGGNAKDPIQDLANRLNGILVEDAPDNWIGGLATSPGAPPGNLISGNVEELKAQPPPGSAVHIRGLQAQNNAVLGNLIGTDISGTQKLPNRGHGVHLEGAPNNRVGGIESGARNIISGNGGTFYSTGSTLTNADFGGNGIWIDGINASSNRIMGNYIGPDISGTKTLLVFSRFNSVSLNEGNKGTGVMITDAPGNFIGGANISARNLISGNHLHGVAIYGANAAGNLVQGNIVGAEVTGTKPLNRPASSAGQVFGPQGNRLFGILLNRTRNNTIGGSVVAAGNLVAFNGLPTSDEAVPFGGGLEIVTCSQNLVQNNIITQNGIQGISIFEGYSAGETSDRSACAGNRLTANSIFENGGLGIDLNGDNRVEINDPGDPDIGPNMFQNFPVIISITDKPGFPDLRLLKGSLSSAPNSTFTIEFFSNKNRDRSGFGEGETYLRSLSVMTDARGNASFEETFPSTAPNIVATAADIDGNTSEFSNVAPLIVNSAGDQADADPNDSVPDVDLSLPGIQTTLRAALQYVNANPGLDRIHFDIPMAVASAVPNIVAGSPLPPIMDSVVIDGTTQPDSHRVRLTSSFGDSHGNGLEFTKGDNMAGGLIIEGFPGNGIYTSSPGVLELDTMSILQNGAWGIQSAGPGLLRINKASGILYAPTNAVSLCCSNGIQKWAGGILSTGRIEAVRLEASDNLGFGIVALKDIHLTQFKVNRNQRGGGIQSIAGKIVLRNFPRGEENEVIGNHGMGIISGNNWELNPGGGASLSTEFVSIQTSVQVISNSLGGITAERGSVAINMTASKSSAGLNLSRIAYNGLGGSTGYVMFQDWSSMPVDGTMAIGGVCVAQGALNASHLEISRNKGPGLWALGDIYLFDVKANYNSRGPGIQSLQGNITVDYMTADKIVNEVIGNHGPGIMAGLEFMPGETKSGSAWIRTSILVLSNSSWGIVAPDSAVWINTTPTSTSSASPFTCHISGNGNPDDGGFFVDASGKVSVVPLQGGHAGGVLAGTELLAKRIEINGNYGPGLLAGGDLKLRWITAKENRGPGIQSLSGSITIDPGVNTYPENQVIANHGPGICSGTELSIDLTVGAGPKIINLSGVEIKNNGGWGVIIENGSVQIFGESGINYSGGYNTISLNGDHRLGCFFVDPDWRLISWPVPRESGGVGAVHGDVVGNYMQVMDNTGVGIMASRDITLRKASLADNTGGNLWAGRNINLADVTLSDPDADGISEKIEQGAPHQGDGNQDGVLDSQQANVASMPGPTGNYLTLAAPAGMTLVNATILNVTKRMDLPGQPGFPAGLLGFSVNLNTKLASPKITKYSLYSTPAPGHAVVELLLPATSGVLQYLRFGPTPGNPESQWYNFNFDGTTGAKYADGKIQLYFVDGQRGDDDLSVNGIILHQHGGPAYYYELRLSLPNRNLNGQWHFFLQGAKGMTYQIDSTTNWSFWIPLFMTNTVADSVEIIDTNTIHAPYRFYRARQMP